MFTFSRKKAETALARCVHVLRVSLEHVYFAHSFIRDHMKKNLWARRHMELLFECSTRYLTTISPRSGSVSYRSSQRQKKPSGTQGRLSASSEWDIKLNTRREIPCPRAEVSAGVLKEILFKWNWRLYEGFRWGWKWLSFFHFFSACLQRNASMRIDLAISYQ